MPKNTTQRIIDSKTQRSGAVFTGGTGGGTGGVTDHGALTGLTDDDHGQYHNDTRGDARYVPLARTVTAGAGLTGGGALSANITVTVGAGLGITVNADDVALASSVAGNGLTYSSGVLAVGVSGLGLSVAADAVTLTSSSNPGAAAAILASTAGGALTLQGLAVQGNTTLSGASTGLYIYDRTTGVTDQWQVYVDGGTFRLWKSSEQFAFSSGGNLSTASHLTLQSVGDTILDPDTNLVKIASGVSFQSHNYASQLTGMRVTNDGQADFRYIYTDELHAKSFIADLEQALAGGQIISKSVAMLGAAFTAPAASGTATLTVRDLPSAENMAVFQSGDIVRLRSFSRAGGSLTIADCWGVVTAYADQADKLQTWTFTRSAAPNAGTMAASTVVAVDSIVLDYGTTGNGYHEVNAIDGMYGANSPYSQIVTWATHPATGQTVRTRMGNLYGLFSVANEYGLYAGSGTANTNQYLRISSNAVRLNNVPLTLYNSGTQTVNIDSAGVDIWVGPSSGDKRLTWNGTTLSVTGTIVVTGGSGIGSFTDANLDNITNGTTYGRVNNTIISGGNIRVGSGTKDSTLSGFHIDSGEIVGQASGVDQVVMDTTGKIKFGAGNGVLDASGVALYYDAATTPAVWSRITWYNTPATRTTEIGSIAFGDDDSVYAPEVAPADRGHALRIKSTNSTIPDIYVQSTTNSYEVWHQGNDGSGSTLDADTLDTYHASEFGRLGIANTWTQAQTIAVVKGSSQRLNLQSNDTETDGAAIAMYGKDFGTSGFPGNIDFVANSRGATGGQINYYTYNGTSYLNRMQVSRDGRVGIGATNNTYLLEVNGTTHIVGALTSAGAIGGTWSTMTTLSGQTEISGRAAQTRRFGDITFLRGAIDPADDTGPIDLVTIATSTHRPARTQYLQTTALGTGTEPSASRSTMHLKIHTDGIIECMSNTTNIQLISFDGLFFFNA